MTQFHIDIAPMQESEFTGIPQVTAKLCEMLLGDGSVDPGFFCGRTAIPTAFVEQLLVSRDGRMLRWAAERYRLEGLVERPTAVRDCVGLHTNMKFARRLFPVEGQVVHDLTTVVTPHYHTGESNAYHQERFYGDLMSNDVTFCVSESTASDVRAFFPDIPGPILVAPLGVDWDHIDAENRDFVADAERYVLVLGTLEPRKNVRDVLKLLSEQPQLARQYRFVFVGRIGWGDAFEGQIAGLGLEDLYREGRIMRTGFVSEAAKYLLIKHAAAVIYPSVYEGFGLPLAEALSLGAPVVTTPSSSLPEVGGEDAHYFLPGDVKMLAHALKAALGQRQAAADGGEAVRARAQGRFSWQRCYETIKTSLLAVAAGPGVREGAADVRR